MVWRGDHITFFFLKPDAQSLLSCAGNFAMGDDSEVWTAVPLERELSFQLLPKLLMKPFLSMVPTNAKTGSILSLCYYCLDAPHLIPTGLVYCAALLTVTSDDKDIG